jgi:superfamily II DNA/RNA helicase
MNIVEVAGVHRTLPHVKHQFEETKGMDKLIVLKSILERNHPKMKRTLIFCNTIDSCRAVEYAINDTPIFHALTYHGDMNSIEREENLKKFRNGICFFLINFVCCYFLVSLGEADLLVGTDIAARGLDIPEIEHVIIFDFPLNPIDYIHRAGRCGRAGRKGTVTSIITKRDVVLSMAIQAAMAKGLPLDSLSASKKDYTVSRRILLLFLF